MYVYCLVVVKLFMQNECLIDTFRFKYYNDVLTNVRCCCILVKKSAVAIVNNTAMALPSVQHAAYEVGRLF